MKKIATAFIAASLALTVSSCSYQHHDTTQPMSVQVSEADLPALPVPEYVVRSISTMSCQARDNGMEHDVLTQGLYEEGLSAVYDEDQVSTLVDIMYANDCPEYR